MTIIPLHAFSDNYIWVMANTTPSGFVCVDPGDASPVLQYAKEHHCPLRAILLTHHHMDHIGGVATLLQSTPHIPVFGPYDERIPFITHPLKEGDTVDLVPFGLDVNFSVLEIPGHTATHIAYYAPSQAILMCGDTLFSAGCGRVFDGTPRDLYASLARLKQLPDDTRVYCAHEYTEQNLRFAARMEPNNDDVRHALSSLHQHAPHCTLPSTIGQEKKINPFFRTDCPELIQSLPSANPLNLNDSLDVFTYLRQEKNHFS